MINTTIRSILVVIGLSLCQLVIAQDPCDPPLTASISSNSPVCAGNDVTLTFNLPVDDGDGFEVTYSIGGNTFTLSGVTDGVTAQHAVTASTTATLLQVINNDDDDDDVCFTDFNQTINIVVSAPIVSIASQTNPGCNQTNGIITVSATGGTGAYQYSINGDAFSGNATFTGLQAGPHTITVRDAANCTDDVSTTLTTPGAPTLTIASQTNPGCGQSNGIITVSATGGTGAYQYSINGGAFSANATFTGLAAGPQVITVRDGANCTNTVNATLTTPNAPTVTVTSQTNPGCGQNNGTITVSATGGSTPYQYSINGGALQSGATFTALGAGAFTITVQDGAGCSANISTSLSNPGAPTLTVASQTNPACGQTNGTITVSATGGTAPYQYSINGGALQSGATFTALGAGAFTITVQDGAGCSANISTTLSNPGAPTLVIVSHTGPACGQMNGIITVSATGGTAPYQYRINNGALQNPATFSGLDAGAYSVVVVDGAGCSATISTTLSNPGAPTLVIASQTNPACGQTNGSITVSATGGTTPYQYSINGSALQSGATFTALGAGAFTITVQDGAGCANSISATLVDPLTSLPAATITASELIGCENTNFILTGNLPAGITGVWDCDELLPNDPQNPTWQLSGASIGDIRITWTLSTTDCPNYSQAIEILMIVPPPVANPDGVIVITDNDNNDIAILANDEASSPVQCRIIKNPTQGIASIDSQNEITYLPNSGASGLDTIIYEVCYQICDFVCDTALVIVRNEENDSPCVIQGDTTNLFTNGITPNGDGYNDALTFRVVDIEECAINSASSDIIIYNRWGDVVFSAIPYGNNWKGRRKAGDEGDKLPPGVYYFVLRIKPEERTYTQFGSVILLE
jgi:gliding motility-associated-like protein